MSKSVVVDNGSYEMRFGLSGDETPLETFYTMDKEFLHNGQVPMKRGLINDFDAMDKVWRYGFNALQKPEHDLDSSPLEMSVIMSEHPLAPKLHTEKITQHIFEQYEVPAFYIANQGLLALYSCGKITGIVCDVGYEQTRFTPIYEGLAFTHAADFVNIGGKHVNDYLKQLIFKQLESQKSSEKPLDGMDTSDDSSHSKPTTKNTLNTDFLSMNEQELNNTFNDEVIEQMKRKVVFTTNYEYSKQLKMSQELKQKTEESMQSGSADAGDQTGDKKKQAKTKSATLNYYKDYTLPDGKKIWIGQIERFLPTEVFFNPSAHNKELEIPGIQTILFECASQCEFDTKKEMLSNVIVCGSTASINGFPKRVTIEVQELATTSTIVSLIESKDPVNAVWYGASVLSSLSSFNQMWIKKGDYNEYGPQIIHRRTY
ncbi:hypothetical protein FDP41_011922 [Naegleria fowleri]|uniref:Actin n=1 Tax=Naegleria fowleri TaxID=5763 RepID=A0A6A5C4N5_NAEFO|nr:uncharacterized protein FDP41_011922 [Naegleria fowleri]KAF0982061.1 hypothetical protein FDP41_011922 [Naegleria fowleri]CAG4709591.1 unnamed protein product [Naegleria fowleri]